jgi:hypothetical protein
MERFFNTSGRCWPGKHYMLPAERRVTDLRRLVDQEQYFVVHAPRQVGKTTSLGSLAETLTAEGRHAALLTSCEMGQKMNPDYEGSMNGILAELQIRAQRALPEELRPPASDTTVPMEARLRELLTRWSEQCPRPVVIFFDEIDALYDDVLISVLRQLRSGYDSRPQAFPQSVALIGLRDVRDYKVLARGSEQTMGSASPFNIKSDSLLLRNFTAEEVGELYDQHTAETGQVFAEAAKAKAFELTRGQPWLLNALARQLVEQLVPERDQPVGSPQVEQAKEALIARRDTHLDSLIDRLREARVERVIAPILAGELTLGDRIDDDLAYVEDLGLIDSSSGNAEIANPIYQEIIPRALAGVTQKTIPHQTQWYLTPDGRLDMSALLTGFLDFWCEHGEAMMGSQPYREVAFQLVVLSFLQRITNGDGSIHREYALGRGRMDLLVEWPYSGGVQREVLELKVWRDGKGDPLAQALGQLGGYLDTVALDHGALLIFDRRQEAPPVEERSEMGELEHDGRRICVVRL